METLHSFLYFCSYLFGLWLFFYLIEIIYLLFHLKECGITSAKQFFCEISPFSLNIKRENIFSGPFLEKSICVIICGFIVLGAFNIIASKFFASERIGAFYEKAEYTRDYDATLDLGEQSIFCIATVERMNGDYWIIRIELPYNHVAYTGEEYYPWDNNPAIEIGDAGYYLNFKLGKPSTGDSYEKLMSYELPQTGEFCASKKSNVFHYLKCRYVKNIEYSNLIYFQNECEADVFGYTMCSVCRDLYY